MKFNLIFFGRKRIDFSAQNEKNSKIFTALNFWEKKGRTKKN